MKSLHPFTMPRSLLLACFFLSGATGLVYESLWTRVLTLAFGHTVWATSAVIAVFMGGLALGSRILGRLADRVPDPIRLYALLELSLGVYCLAVPLLLDFSRGAYLSWGPPAGGGIAARLLLQVPLTAVVLLLPAALMGGTLPALARAFIRGPVAPGPGVAVLYGINTLGAMAGAFAAGYLLLPALGNRATNLSAAAVNVAIGGVLLLAGRARVFTREMPPEPAAGGPTSTASAASPITLPLLLGAFFATGAAGMTAQIAWVRTLILVIGSSTYAFSAVLTTFLAGLALGSLLFPRLRLSTPAHLAALLAATALSLAALLPAFSLLPPLFLALFSRFSASYSGIQFVQLLVAGMVMIVPTTLMGLSFPLLAGMAVRDRERMGETLGRLYAANTVGAILGTMAAGFALIPLAGAQKTLAVASTVYLLAASALLFPARPRARNLSLAGALALGIVLLLAPPWERDSMTKGVAVYTWGYLRERSASTPPRRGDIIYFREGISSTVAVSTDGKDHWLSVNGKTDASSGSMDGETQGKSALLPLLLHPGARRVGIVGLGSGMTAGVAGLFPEVEKIEVFEIEPAVAKAARYFGSVNQGILDDRRLLLHIDDGRSALASPGPPFDVIISEPSNPWIAGVANLFTFEAVAATRSRLAPGGIFCLWLHTYSVTPESYRMVVRTFERVFPDASLWQSIDMGDTFLIGRREGGDAVKLDIAALKRRIAAVPALADAFSSFPLKPLDLFLTSFLLGPGDLRRFAGNGPLNTDDHNRLEFEAARSYYMNRVRELSTAFLDARRSDRPPFLSDPLLERPDVIRYLGESHLKMGETRLASWTFRRLPSLAPPLPAVPLPLLLPPGGAFIETFGSIPVLPLLPAPEGIAFDPSDAESTASLEATLDHLTRTSGILPRGGEEGGRALVLRGLPLFGTSYFVPLAAEPGEKYEVRFSMRSGMGDDGTAGARMLEYDVRETGSFLPSPLYDQSHLARASTLLTIRGPSGWRDYSFSLTASPRTQMIHLRFFRRGGAGDNTVAFGRIAIRRTPPGRGD